MDLAEKDGLKTVNDGDDIEIDQDEEEFVEVEEEEEDEDSEDPDYGFKRYLAVNPTDIENFNPSQDKPENGSQYLLTVMEEFKRTPKIITARDQLFDRLNQSSQQKANKSENQGNASKDTYDTNIDHGLHWTSDWENDVIQKFIELREKMSTMRGLIATDKVKLTSPVINIPDVKQVSHCLSFTIDSGIQDRLCKGNHQQPFESIIKTFYEDEENTVSSFRRSPLLSVLLQIPQRSLELLIAHHSNWLRKWGLFHYQQSEWVYGLLVAIEKPLEPSVVGDLRQMARLCLTIRQNFYKKVSKKLSINNATPTSPTVSLNETESESAERMVVDEMNDLKIDCNSSSSNTSNSNKAESDSKLNQIKQNLSVEEVIYQDENCRDYVNNLNLFVCIVANYFCQKDLIQDLN